MISALRPIWTGPLTRPGAGPPGYLAISANTNLFGTSLSGFVGMKASDRGSTKVLQLAQHARREGQHRESLVVFASQSGSDSVQIAFLSTREKQALQQYTDQEWRAYESHLH
jgi:hypothetical protein